MTNQSEAVEQVGPQARLQAELLKLESQKREFWIIVVFAALVLLLGVLTFFFPLAYWRGDTLHVSFSPQVLFVLMVAVVLVALFYVRRDMEIRGMRMTSLLQLFVSRQKQAASMVDAVTNVFTRGFLHDLLQGEIARAERSKRPLALVMCDINGFKQVNDRYGHLMGDYILSQFATILKSCVRGSDYVIRYGGDEFLLILSETDESGAETVCQRIHRKVAEWDQDNRVGDLPLTVSLGMYLHVAGQTPEKDIAEADARMYAEKQASRQTPSLPFPTDAR